MWPGKKKKTRKALTFIFNRYLAYYEWFAKGTLHKSSKKRRRELFTADWPRTIRGTIPSQM